MVNVRGVEHCQIKEPMSQGQQQQQPPHNGGGFSLSKASRASPPVVVDDEGGRAAVKLEDMMKMVAGEEEEEEAAIKQQCSMKDLKSCKLEVDSASQQYLRTSSKLDGHDGGGGVKRRNRARTEERELAALSPSDSLVGWKVDSSSKRARRPPTRFVEVVSNDYKEEADMQQALQNSKIETQLLDTPDEIPEVKTFMPRVEEFRDPIRYIESIRAEAERYGVAKIIPPQGWQPPPTLDASTFPTFSTRLQEVKHFKEGKGYGEGKRYTYDRYREMADAFRAAWIESRYTSKGLPEPSLTELEREYWRMVETAEEDIVVEYGNDLDTLTYGSGFPRPSNLYDGSGNIDSSWLGPSDDDDMSRPEYYHRCGWNINNIPFWPGSLLRYVRAPIKGVNVPWLYMGMLFATFCWHNEDNFMYSVNYLHTGAPKQWYVVPGQKADALEKVLKGFLKENFEESPDLLHHMTTLFSPMLLQRSGVPVYRAVQHAGHFIITFPKSYHAGFSYGHNCAEAVNFSSVDWVRYGREAVDRYRRFGRPSVFSHERLILTLTSHLKDERWSAAALKSLLDDLRRIVEEEDYHRKRLRERRVRFGMIERCRLAANNLDFLDNSSLDYDEKRMCVACRQICFLSAVACECSQDKVACVHELDTVLCECPSDKKYVIEWNEMQELRDLLKHLEEYALNMKKQQHFSLPASSRCVL